MPPILILGSVSMRLTNMGASSAATPSRPRPVSTFTYTVTSFVAMRDKVPAVEKVKTVGIRSCSS